MAKGKKTGGRKKGVPNKIHRKAEREKAAASGGITPLDYMLELMRDKEQPILIRTDMAKAAAPYLHAKRAPEDKHGQTAPMGCLRIDAYDPSQTRQKTKGW